VCEHSGMELIAFGW